VKLLLINPNITAAMTDSMADEARRFASPGTVVVAVTAVFGTQYVENRAEAAIASHAVLDALAKHAAGCDAAIVCAFGDPGLAAAREFADIPVVGIEESAILTAWMLGRRYSIICLTPRLRTWYIECAQEHGLAGRLASVRALDAPIADITRAKAHSATVWSNSACARSNRTRRRSSSLAAVRSPAWHARCATTSRCPRLMASAAPCGWPRRWLACGLVHHHAAASRARPPSRLRVSPPN
jgi:Asp/Glu/hydantoin racemase